MSNPGGFKLIVEDDEGQRSVVPVELGEVSIGRLEANTIRLDQRNVSRHHARLRRDSDAIIAEDLDSYNGVYINGERVDGRTTIHEGDQIRIGDYQLELRGQGLSARREEPTQKTVIPKGPQQSEATQPEIRLMNAGGEATPTVPDAGGKISTRDDSPPNEATAIIRVSELRANPISTESRAIAGDKPKLVCVSTQFAGREFLIDKTEVVIGRTEDNDISIDHRSISRHHCKVFLHGNRWLLKDLGSANGTLVNQEEYAQTELRSGDLIEIGHVRLRFVPAGESYRFTAEEAAAMGRPRSPSPTDGEATLADFDEASGSGARNWLLIGAIGAGVLAVVAMAALLWPRDSQIGPAALAETDATQEPVVEGGEVDKLLAKADSALAERRWRQAAVLGGAVLELEPSSRRATGIVARAEREEVAQGHYETANNAIQTGDWERAWNALQEIPDASVYHPQAAKLVEQVRGALITERIARGNRALGDERWDQAEDIADEIAGLQNDHPDAASMRDAAQEGRANSRKRASAAAPKRSTPKPAVTKKPEKTAPPPAATKSSEPAAPAADPKALFRDGAKALKEGKVSRAIDLFNQCVQADRRFGLCYRALGIAHAKAGNGEKAAENYEKYIKVMPNAPDREDVIKLLEQYRGGR